MKQFLVNLLRFLVFATTLYLVLILVWGEFVPNKFQKNLKYRLGADGHIFTRLQEGKDHENIDVLFIGSSHAYRGFDTRIFAKHGLRTFNLGSSAQTPLQTRLLLNRYLPKLRPQTVVFEVFPRMFSSDGVESSLQLIANDAIDSLSFRMAFQQNDITVYNTLIYGLYAELIGRRNRFSEKPAAEHDLYIEGGYVEHLSNPEGLTRKTEFPPSRWDFHPMQFEELDLISKELEQRGIELILIQAPMVKAYYSSFANNDEFDRRMKKYGNYYNFNELLELDFYQHFYDFNHMTQAGVDLFNAEVLKILNQR